MREKNRTILLMFCLCVAAAIPFLPALQGEFTNWDDQFNVTENPYIEKGLKEGLFLLLTRSYEGLYIPLTYAVYWLQFHLWGANAGAFHLINLFVHMANVALVFAVLRRLLSMSLPAFLAALWWGVQPLHVEAVAWVTGLKDLLSVLMMLVSFRLYMLWREQSSVSSEKGFQRPFVWLASLTAFALACLSKPGVVAFPMVLMGYDVFAARRRWKELWPSIPYFMVSGLFIIVTMSVQKAEEGGVVAPNVLGRLRVAADCMLFYMGKLLWPAGLSPVYGRMVTDVLASRMSWVRLLWAIGIIGVLSLPGWRWRFGVLIFLAGFLPVSGVVPFGYQRLSIVADRYVYFSSVGMALIGGDVISRFGYNSANRMNRRGIAASACLIIWLLMLGAVVWTQSHVWRSSLSLWVRAITIKPDMPQAHYNLGEALGKRGDYDRAIEEFTSALDLKPDYADAYNNRATALRAKGEYEKAITDYNRAVELLPKSAKVRYHRGVAYSAFGKYDLAIIDYNEAIRLQPDHVKAYNNRGAAWLAKGNFEQAIADCSNAIELSPDYAEAYNNRAIAWTNKGDYFSAIRDCTQAITLNPNYVEAYNNRAVAMTNTGEYDRAIQDCGRVIELKANNPQAYHNRARALAAKRDYAGVVRDCTRAIEFKSDYAEAYNDRGSAWIMMGDLGRAIEDCASAVKIRPNYADAYHNRAVAYYGLKRHEEAWADVKQCRELGGDVNPALIELLMNAAESKGAKP